MDTKEIELIFEKWLKEIDRAAAILRFICLILFSVLIHFLTVKILIFDKGSHFIQMKLCGNDYLMRWLFLPSFIRKGQKNVDFLNMSLFYQDFSLSLNFVAFVRIVHLLYCYLEMQTLRFYVQTDFNIMWFIHRALFVFMFTLHVGCWQM